MNLKQRANLIAQILASAGVNQTSIIAILNNAITESGGQLDPKITEYGRKPVFSNTYAFGCGIWQWSYLSNGNKQVYEYARSHSEEDSIKMQVNKVLSEPSQWIPRSPYNFSFTDFLHNTKKLTWQELTIAWCVCWERPSNMFYQGRARQNNYSKFMPLDFNNVNSGNNTDTPSGNIEKKKFPTTSECLSMLKKYKNILSSDGQEKNNQTSNTGMATSSFNFQKVDNYYNTYKNSLKYSMSLRANVVNGSYSDCSAFVTYMLKLGYNIDYNFLQNTETLHSFLKSNGFKLIEQTTGTHLNNTFRAGDVFILGKIGTSIGASGHTLICGNGYVYDCHGPVGALGLGKQTFEHFNNNYLTYTRQYWSGVWTVYHYSRGG